MMYEVVIKNNTYIIKGILRLNNVKDYMSIKNDLIELSEQVSELIIQSNGTISGLIIDTTELEMMNSSGVTMLCQYFIEIKSKDIKVVVIGNNNSEWQKKTFPLFNRINNNITVIWK